MYQICWRPKERPVGRRPLGCSRFSFGRDRQRQNTESPCRERQRSLCMRTGPVDRPSSDGGSGRAWLSAAPIRNSRSMLISSYKWVPSFRLSEIELSTLPTPSVNGTERLDADARC